MTPDPGKVVVTIHGSVLSSVVADKIALWLATRDADDPDVKATICENCGRVLTHRCQP